MEKMKEELGTIKDELLKLIEVVEEIEKRTVEKPSDSYTNTPIKQQLTRIKYQIKYLIK
jgi:hypothetical protein